MQLEMDFNQLLDMFKSIALPTDSKNPYESYSKIELLDNLTKGVIDYSLVNPVVVTWAVEYLSNLQEHSDDKEFFEKYINILKESQIKHTDYINKLLDKNQVCKCGYTKWAEEYDGIRCKKCKTTHKIIEIFINGPTV